MHVARLRRLPPGHVRPGRPRLPLVPSALRRSSACSVARIEQPRLEHQQHHHVGSADGERRHGSRGARPAGQVHQHHLHERGERRQFHAADGRRRHPEDDGRGCVRERLDRRDGGALLGAVERQVGHGPRAARRRASRPDKSAEDRLPRVDRAEARGAHLHRERHLARQSQERRLRHARAPPLAPLRKVRDARRGGAAEVEGRRAAGQLQPPRGDEHSGGAAS
mmetsp:Transcript_5013/g.10945  ORF Transcript_5013/g.10945 Transcript_5013/m.10945 type:complete len:223 (+) Transcript_5013:829-1497(+)